MSHVILDPYSLVDIRFLIRCARQDFINSVLDLRALNKKKWENNTEKGLLFRLIEARRINRAILEAQSKIREKRLLLDDLERALRVASEGLISTALKEREDGDDSRYERRLKDIAKRGERMTESELLLEISKQIAEIFLFMEKTDYQKQRRLEWERCNMRCEERISARPWEV